MDESHPQTQPEHTPPPSVTKRLEYTEYGQALADAGLMPPVPPEVSGIPGLDDTGYPIDDPTDDVERVRLAARDLIAELFRVIEGMTEPFDPCRYDHHDQCQEHYLHDRPCPWDRARVLLDELHEADGA